MAVIKKGGISVTLRFEDLDQDTFLELVAALGNTVAPDLYGEFRELMQWIENNSLEDDYERVRRELF